MNSPQQSPQNEYNNRFKRRTIFIKKNLQLRYMMLIIISVLSGLAIMTFELTATLNDLFDNYPVLIQPLYDEFLQNSYLSAVCYFDFRYPFPQNGRSGLPL